MGIVIKKEFFYHVLFTICVAIPYINVYEITFAIWTTALLLTLKRRYSMKFVHYLGYFGAIFLIALVVSFFRDDVQLYNFLRDWTYLLKPIIGLTLGYQLCKDYIKSPLKVIANTAFIIAIAHILVVAHSVTFLHVRNISDLRMYSGYFSDFEIYALIIIIFNQQLGLEISEKTKKIFLTVISISSVLYLARTNFIQFALLYMAMKGYFTLNKKSLTVMVSLAVFVIVGYSIIYSYNPNRGAKGIEAFMYKVKNAPIEPFKTKVDKDDWKDFNDNYRSYENILTLRQVSQSGPLAVAFGEGMGSSIDLKKRVWLQTSFMRYIPFLHNGFMTVFLKSGIAGLLFYFSSILFFYRQERSSVPVIRQLNLLLLGTGIFLIVSNWVFLGFYNLYDTKTVLMGFLLAYKERLNKQAIA